MKTKLEVLYARQIDLSSNKGDSQSPVARYSDACAAIERLESDVEQKEQLRTLAVARCEYLLGEIERVVATCERLQAELMAARYGQQAVDTMLATIQSQTRLHVHGGDTGHALPEQMPGRNAKGRWDGKLKAL